MHIYELRLLGELHRPPLCLSELYPPLGPLLFFGDGDLDLFLFSPCLEDSGLGSGWSLLRSALCCSNLCLASGGGGSCSFSVSASAFPLS